MLYCAKIIEETDLKRRRMKSEDRKMKEIEIALDQIANNFINGSPQPDTRG